MPLLCLLAAGCGSQISCPTELVPSKIERKGGKIYRIEMSEQELGSLIVFTSDAFSISNEFAICVFEDGKWRPLKSGNFVGK